MRPIGCILSVGVALLLLSAVAVSQTADTAVWGDLYSMRERGIRQPDSIAVATPQLTDSPERALAQPAVTTFEIVRPVDRLTVGLNVRQAVILRWIVNGEPIANQRIDFSTSAGTLSQSVAETDDFGLAVVFVESPEAGEATISANYTGILSDVVVVGFEERDPDFDSYRSGDRDIQLQLQNKQIGFQTRTGVSHADALKIAEENDLRFVQTYYRGVYIFELRNAYSLDALHLLAKNLERLYPNEIRLAGPVFISAASTAPLLKSDQMLIGFIGPPSTTDLKRSTTTFRSVTRSC